MSNDKQSSVEWFNCELEHLLKEYGFISKKMLNIHYKRAKAMHKEEMKQTYFDGWHRNIGNRDEDFEQYYNETYGGNNEQQ